MKGTSQQQLQKAFCIECFERMQRAKMLLQQYDTNANASECFDYLHQEFDSMVGASRVLHYPLLEKFNRSIASFCRFIRDRLPLPVPPKYIKILHEAIDLVVSCDGKLTHCLSLREASIQVLTEQVDYLMTEK